MTRVLNHGLSVMMLWIHLIVSFHLFAWTISTIFFSFMPLYLSQYPHIFFPVNLSHSLLLCQLLEQNESAQALDQFREMPQLIKPQSRDLTVVRSPGAQRAADWGYRGRQKSQQQEWSSNLAVNLQKVCVWWWWGRRGNLHRQRVLLLFPPGGLSRRSCP